MLVSVLVLAFEFVLFCLDKSIRLAGWEMLVTILYPVHVVFVKH